MLPIHFHCFIVFHCVNILQIIYALGLLPVVRHPKQCCCKNSHVLFVYADGFMVHPISIGWSQGEAVTIASPFIDNISLFSEVATLI